MAIGAILFTWLHLLGAVTWVGGIIFILYIAMPSSKQVLGPEAGKLMGDISKRFTPFANYSILLLVVTGLALTWVKGHFQGGQSFEGAPAFAMALKYLAAAMMIVIHFYRGLVLARKIAMAEPVRKTAMQKRSLNLVKVNLLLGVLILLLSGITRF